MSDVLNLMLHIYSVEIMLFFVAAIHCVWFKEIEKYAGEKRKSSLFCRLTCNVVDVASMVHVSRYVLFYFMFMTH